ncbi:hypothetical protein V8C86DRAFT_3135510 [Haematococcus lacustris]
MVAVSPSKGVQVAVEHPDWASSWLRHARLQTQLTQQQSVSPRAAAFALGREKAHVGGHSEPKVLPRYLQHQPGISPQQALAEKQQGVQTVSNYLLHHSDTRAESKQHARNHASTAGATLTHKAGQGSAGRGPPASPWAGCLRLVRPGSAGVTSTPAPCAPAQQAKTVPPVQGLSYCSPAQQAALYANLLAKARGTSTTHSTEGAAVGPGEECRCRSCRTRARLRGSAVQELQAAAEVVTSPAIRHALTRGDMAALKAATADAREVGQQQRFAAQAWCDPPSGSLRCDIREADGAQLRPHIPASPSSRLATQHTGGTSLSRSPRGAVSAEGLGTEGHTQAWAKSVRHRVLAEVQAALDPRLGGPLAAGSAGAQPPAALRPPQAECWGGPLTGPASQHGLRGAAVAALAAASAARQRVQRVAAGHQQGGQAEPGSGSAGRDALGRRVARLMATHSSPYSSEGEEKEKRGADTMPHKPGHVHGGSVTKWHAERGPASRQGHGYRPASVTERVGRMAGLIRQHTQSLRQSSGSSDEGTGNDIRQPTHSIEAKRWGHSPGQTLRTAPFAKQGRKLERAQRTARAGVVVSVSARHPTPRKYTSSSSSGSSSSEHVKESKSRAAAARARAAVGGSSSEDDEELLEQRAALSPSSPVSAAHPAGVAASTTRKALVTKFAQAALTPTAKAGVPAAQRRAIAVLRERRLQALEEKDASRRGGESGATDASED